MSVAPNSAYLLKKSKDILATGSDSFTQYRDLLFAKFLKNTTATTGDDWGNGYFNSTDTEAEKKAKMKDISKVDGWVNADYAQQKTGTVTISGTSVSGSGTAFTTDFVVGQKVGALVTTDGVLKCVETYIITAITSDTAMSVVAGTNRSGIAYCNYHQGWIGYCYSRTSGNGLYHNWDNNTSPFIARGSGVMVPTTTNADGELLNDAGLNRKAHIEIVTASPNWSNWINLDLYMRAAFYDGVSDYGYSWKIGAGSYTDVSASIGTIGVKEKRSQRVRQIELTGLDPEETVYFKPWITNGEGTFYGAETYFTADEIVWYDGAYEVVSPSGAVIPYAYLLFATSSDISGLPSVTTSDAATGIFLYVSEYFVSGNLLPTGWYVIGSENTKAYYVVNGEVRKYETRTPSTAHINLSLINKGMDETPDWRVFALVVDEPTGFPNTIEITTVVKYYIYSGGTYAETGSALTVLVNLIDGDSFAESSLSLIPPPVGATHSQVTTSTTEIGLPIVSPYTAI